MGDGSVVESYAEYFATLQSRVMELKAQGISVDAIADELTRELEPQYTDWPSDGAERIEGMVRAAHAEAL